MLKRFCTSVLLGAFALGASSASGSEPFSYYVLALSWNAAWCDREGDSRKAQQCDPKHDHGFTLHGLWPQHDRGWPEFCRTAKRDPSRRMTRDMSDIMGSGGLAWHQWKKHGRCTGLSAADYFALSREAYAKVARPEVLRKIDRPLDVPPQVLEDAFMEVNPGLSANGVTVTCKSGQLAEIRICLDKTLNFKVCAPDAARDCSKSKIEILPMR